MDEKELEYATKYKKRIVLLALIFMIFIIIMGLGLISLGIYMIVVSEAKVEMIFVGIILLLMGVSDIPLGIYFRFRVNKRIKSMSDETAIKRYKRIYGIK